MLTARAVSFDMQCDHANQVESVTSNCLKCSKPDACLLLITLLWLAGWTSLSAANDIQSAENSIPQEEPIPGPLDGMTFTGALGPDGKPKDIPDSFVFENGTFVSKECELRCKYPARPYFVRSNGERIDFISETKCPYKDAKITWRGTVEGDRIKGKSTWVVKRWYWTVENTFEFEGTLTNKPASTVSTE